MKGKSIAGALLAVVVLGGIAACSVAWHSAIDPIDPPPTGAFDKAMVARGMQLAAVGDCMACHTAAGGKSYAGGLPLQTPFGTIYSTNITPDAQTGIGRWPLEAFSRALQQGVSRDGHLLYPAFPYVHFTHMSPDDIKAVYAFMMTRTPVQYTPPANNLTFPFNFRPLVAGWNLLFLRTGELPEDSSRSPEWLRGRYLVEGPGHCAACHTPMNALGAEKSGAAFAGGLIDGWDVPPLNALAQGPRPWTADQLTSYLRTGLAAQHGAAAGPMLPVAHHLGDVAESDVRAIAAYLLSPDVQTAQAKPAADAAPAAAAANPADTQRLNDGAALFASTCASCHGAAAPMMAIGGRPPLADSTVVNAPSPRNAINLVLRGIPLSATGPSHYMPSFAHTLNDTQIADVLAYMRTRVAQQPAWSALDGDVAKIRKENESK
jgi:mono/diheme cytochrome c family protein